MLESMPEFPIRPPAVNLMDIVCSHEHPESGYDGLASRIAAFLGWEALDEHAARAVWPQVVSE